jgi:bacillithiol system protein YtxJ
MSFFKNIFTSDDAQIPSNIVWNHLKDLNQLKNLIDESEHKPVLIFKHSTRCSVSRMALRQFENEFVDHNKISLYFIDLLQFRDVSNAVTEQFGIPHQSPQILLIRNGLVLFDASHSSIDAEDLKRYI